MQLHYRQSSYQGFQDVIKAAGGAPMAFSLLRLGAGERHAGRSGDYEVAMVVLSGQADTAVDGQGFGRLGGRPDVFSGRAATLYVPKESKYEITSASPDFEAAFCLVRAEKKYAPFVIAPEEVVVQHRGAELWHRDVHDIIVDNGEGRVDRIVLGETFSAPGNWSSFPSHKHDRHRPPEETKLEEVYHYRVQPDSRFGVQVIYTEDGSTQEAFFINDRDTAYIPYGYHPVAAPPGAKLYYLWFLAGEHGRKMIAYDDPNFRDLKAAPRA